MRIPAASALLLTALLAAAPSAMGQGAASAFPPAGRDGAPAQYLVMDGQAFAVNALVAAGTVYVALEETAGRLGFETAAKDKGMVLRSPKGAVVFSEDFSMAIVGAHLHPVKPAPIQMEGRVYVPAAFLVEHLARFAAAPFSFRDTPPPLELKSIACAVKRHGEGWRLAFEQPPTYSHRMAEKGLDLFFEGQRLRLAPPAEFPAGAAYKMERLPLGDRVRWTWERAPRDVEVEVSEDGLVLTLAPAFPAARTEQGARRLATVILDPGHGGAAVGAIGRRGMLEKDLALRIAVKLRDLLAAQGLQVHLTRESDADVPLAERVDFANARRGDLFVSIHANASPVSSARGAETYFMSYEALDDESRLLAHAENLDAGRGDSVGIILSNMAQARFLGESSRLGEEIQRNFNARLSTPDRGVRQAPFAVLMGVAMPAVLVEVGFLSNPEEERLLEREDYRDRLARSLADSILTFKRARDAAEAPSLAGQ
jgi:N-acetylmuramoyl-L-alanine amidase